MNVNDLVQNNKATKLFKTFLTLGHRTDRSDALINLECYELCEKLQTNALNRTDDAYDELRELCPSERWEERLDEAIESEGNGDATALDTYFSDLMFEAKRQIELHRDYKRFQKELIRKLGR